MLTYFFKIQKLSVPLNDYSELERMLALRKMGFSMSVLAEVFNVDRNTIRYLCRRFGLGEQNVVTTVKRTPSPKAKPVYTEEKINQGHTYAEYLQIERDRKRLQSTTHGTIELLRNERPEQGSCGDGPVQHGCNPDASL